jgi:hypothetical protein
VIWRLLLCVLAYGVLLLFAYGCKTKPAPDLGGWQPPPQTMPSQMRGRATVAREAHNLKVAGSTPAPASISDAKALRLVLASNEQWDEYFGFSDSLMRQAERAALAERRSGGR